MVTEKVERSKASGLGRLAALLREHEQDLGAYVSHDPRGRHVPTYLSQLSEHIMDERDSNLRELAQLRSHIDHIKQIVSVQQSYSKVSGVRELMSPVDLLEDALRMNDGEFHRHEVQVLREFEPVPRRVG